MFETKRFSRHGSPGFNMHRPAVECLAPDSSDACRRSCREDEEGEIIVDAEELCCAPPAAKPADVNLPPAPAGSECLGCAASATVAAPAAAAAAAAAAPTLLRPLRTTLEPPSSPAFTAAAAAIPTLVVSLARLCLGVCFPTPNPRAPSIQTAIDEP